MGNRMDLGMYDECMSIREIENGEEIRGRHCMYSINANIENFTMQETLSICLPSTCEPKDVVIILEAALKMIGDFLPQVIPLSVTSSTCSSVVAPVWTPGGIVTLVGLSALISFLLICTISDFYMRYSEMSFSTNNRLVWLSQFSLYSNAIRVLSTKTAPQTLPAIQGIRFFSMCWVIFGHGYCMSLFVATVNTADFFQWVHSWSAMYILIATFAVDTFFTISGFLLSYLFLKEMSTGRSFNIFAYYIHRYLRLTPALAALLLATIFILPRVGSGALWDNSMITIANNCRENWWPMMLYIHNYYDKDHLWCLAHTWYLAVEMHFFWISPLILYPLARKPSIGLVILMLAFCASVITPTVISYKNGYSSVLFATGNLEIAVQGNMNFYMESHIRAAPWIVGIFFGYLVFKKQTAPAKIIRRIGWLVTILAFAFCFFSLRVFQAKGYEFSTAWETFYTAVSKPLWAGGVGWIMYASVLGFGGPITTVLSYPIYTPFSRISYCVYLVHFVLQILRVSSLRTPQYFSPAGCFTQFLSDLALSAIFGFIFTLMIESPILTVEKIIKRRNQKRLSESKRKLEHNEPSRGVDNPNIIYD
ncbi:nose resistant to fluoxetine protein 6-like isoform X2 [Venturia canescens]|nr:nose resistant to fluoxetine protein 6-like isoform X2 [Venturia canescens]